MNKTKIQQIVVIVLLLVFVIVWSMTRKPSSVQQMSTGGTSAPAEAPKGTEPSSETSPASTQATELKEITITRDFFQPPPLLREAFRQKNLAKEEAKRIREAKPTSLEGFHKEGTAALPSLQLQGIFFGEKPQAIINRQIVSVGDTIEQAEVVSVTPEGVTLSYNGQEMHLTLSDSGRNSSGSGPDHL